ncbi:PH domain-containing protein [Planctomicrobium piriforme]|uniref:PH domain-containing protein n=1 Tax=Planctomicrobium piriforme TaxID=1576369 RepID=A0A1I3B8Q7_9PLAN|nr:PH domain-containing protein [Planctomicrobium piriforme]SFH58705.1 PH domain-containing protein [Planctomicrobium piriforme]
MDEWFFEEQGKKYGPIALTVLQKLVKNGRVTPATPVREGRTGPWVQAADSAADLFPGHAVEQAAVGVDENVYRVAPVFGTPVDAGDESDSSEDWVHAKLDTSDYALHSQDTAHDFSGRSRALPSELAADLVPKSGVPKELKELLASDEKVIYLERPSITVLYVRLAMTCGWGLVVCLAIGLAGSESLLMRLILIVVSSLAFITLPGYLCYLDWANRIYAVTSSRLFLRWGVLDRRIRIAPVRNVQMISINTGVVDRWLNLNTVRFYTAANAGYLDVGGTSLQFRWIDSRKAVRAFGTAASCIGG